MDYDSISVKQWRLFETFLNSDSGTFLTQLRSDPQLDINYAYGWNGEPLLHAACRHRDLGRISLLRQAGADFNVRDMLFCRTALLQTAERADLDVLSYLLGEPTSDQTAEETSFIAPELDLNARDWRGNTALHLLVKAADYPAKREAAEAGLRLLAGRPGIDLDAHNEDGRTPLKLALGLKLVQPALILAEAGAALPAELRPLLESNARLRPLVEQLGRPGRPRPADQLLWEAVSHVQTVEAVGAALQRLNDELTTDDSRRRILDTAIGKYTCLQWAADNGRIDMARQLLDAGADPAKTSAHNPRPPLIYAAEKGNAPMVELLLNPLRAGTGRRLNLTKMRDSGEWGRDDTALHKTARRRWRAADDADFDRCLTLLLEGGVDVNATNSDGETALHLALSSGYESGALLLLAAGASLAVMDNTGVMPIDLVRHDTLKKALDACVRPVSQPSGPTCSEVRKIQVSC